MNDFKDLQIVEVKGMRTLTSKQLAECYGTTTDTIKKNFSRNREKYVEGKHYICFSGDELKGFKEEVTKSHQVNNEVTISALVGNRTSHLYLWTEKGALLHAKSLNTDKAWQVYDYLVDFYFRAKEDNEQKNTFVPVDIKTEPIKEELSQKEECQDAIGIFKILLKAAEIRGLKIKTKPLRGYKSRLWKDRVAVRNDLTLEEVNLEIAYELFHSVVNYDKGDMVNTPLAKYYNNQAEKAAELIISLLNKKIA